MISLRDIEIIIEKLDEQLYFLRGTQKNIHFIEDIAKEYNLLSDDLITVLENHIKNRLPQHNISKNQRIVLSFYTTIDEKPIMVNIGEIQPIYKDIKTKGYVGIGEQFIAFYIPKLNQKYVYDIQDITEIKSIHGIFFKTKLKLTINDSNRTKINYNKCIISFRIKKRHKKYFVILIHLLIYKKKLFEERQIQKGLIQYNLRESKWGTVKEVKKWLNDYLMNRGFQKINGKWMSEREKFNYEQKEKGLYKHITRGKDQWIPLDAYIDSLSPREFERFLKILFENKSYHVIDLPYVRDYGVDLIAEKGNEVLAIQAKKYNKNNLVGAPDVQRALGSMYRPKADKVILITSSGFTEPAYIQSENAPIELWDRNKLKKEIEKHLPSDIYQKDFFDGLELQTVRGLSYILGNILSKTKHIHKPITSTLEYQLPGKENNYSMYISYTLPTVPIIEEIAREEFIPYRFEPHIEEFIKSLREKELNKIKHLYRNLFD
jgi:hypothetical protein